MTDIERALRQLGAEVEYPPTPTLAQRLREQDAPLRRRSGFRWRALTARTVVLAALLVLTLAGGVVAAVPAARDAVLEFVGLRGATVQRVDELPPGVRAKLSARIGHPTNLGVARRSLAFRPLFPTGLGEPNGVFVRHEAPGGELSLTYAPRPGLPRAKYTGTGLLINEVNGAYAPGFYGKLVPRGVRIEPLRVDGDGAIWVGGLHKFQFADSRRNFRIESTRLAGRVLLLQHGQVLVRIEGKMSRERAIAIARSLR